MENFESQVAFWDRVSSLAGEKKRGFSAREVLAAAEPFLLPSKKVLDVGCGQGGISKAMARHVHSVRAIDISSGMIAVAKSDNEGAPISNISFEVGSVFSLSDNENDWNMITSFNVLPYIINLERMLCRLSNMLPPGGLFLISSACLGERMSLLRMLVVTLSKLEIMPKLHQFKSRNLVNLLNDAGFEILEIKKISRLPEYFIACKKR
ncbi:class I SAM-dependent methyltransferase [Gilvimarinus algae]|uniref:Class I SAM-dependent methyltransferase n=1 Tax=Gilvimarinus algae TaxID=3058037 RepID=A0ABT8T9W0_9GAMM|nr:class I SAM-dependent methyltransferase [Gilvimarinus sp. SDUM040014]MDO3380909.1 class I SAM-dependent methyltransferase [Gilvimarinus sp. SDUM040014]